MKLKFNVAQGSAVFTYKDDNATLQKALDLLGRDDVLSITVTKQTPAQYLKTVRALNDRGGGGAGNG